MHFVKLVTSDNDARYINLDQVSRVTLAKDVTRDVPVLVIFFSDADRDAKLEVEGATAADRKAIEQFVAALDGHCKC